MAKLNVRLSPMNAGKSDTLIKTRYNYESQGLATLSTKPSTDTKAGSLISSRTGFQIEPDFIITPDTDVRARILEEQKKITKKHLEEETDRRVVGLQVVLVDEAQFLTRRQASQLYLTALKDNISVIAYGIKGDFLTNTFEGTSRLVELADSVEYMPTMCRCGSQARFNARLVGGKYVFTGSQVAMDGQAEVTYESLCGNCYIEEGGESAILGDN